MVLHVDFPWWVTKARVRVFTGLSHLKFVWKVWDLRSFILLSLSLQALLIFLGPFRKRTANFIVIFSIWLAYLLADYVAIQAVSIIPNHNYKTDTIPAAYAYPTHEDLLAFWAPFLLIHLGGPDPITALALEDNELWLRNFLHLLTYGLATARVFIQSLPANILSIPTTIMFFVGILKYIERTMSLYNASLTRFKSSMLTKPDPGPNYAKLMETYDSYLNSSLPTRFDTNLEPIVDHNNAATLEQDDDYYEDYYDDNDNEVNEDPEEEKKEGGSTLRNVKLVRDAFEFFEKYKGLYVDLIFSFHDRNNSRAYFLDTKLTPEEAFTVLEIELNFTYEVFYTKMIVIHQTAGISIRSISFGLEVFSLLIWTLFIDKRPYHGVDVWITYILLVGAIFIDVVAFLMIRISDWQLAMLDKQSIVRAFFYDKLLSARNRNWGKLWAPQKSTFSQWIRRVLFRRWSESVFQFNLIHYCVHQWSTCAKIFVKLGPIKEKLEGFKFVSKKWFADDFRDFIFDEIRHKAEIAEDPKDAADICESKGDWVLRSLAGLMDFEPFVFYRWTVDVEYDECLLLWHIATEVLYQDEEDENVTDGIRTDSQPENPYRKYSKTLSDYMMYLLSRQPVLMSAVAGISEVRFRDTCAEANIFFDRVLPKMKKKESTEERIWTACKRMMEVNTETKPRDIKGDRSKSVLFDGVLLAKQLKKVREKTKTVGMWELMAKVWVELLSYSATHTRASAHAAQLREGGELLTLIWLLMVHVGLGTQFRINQGNARSKLIISK